MIQRTKEKVRVYSDSVQCIIQKQFVDGKVKWQNFIELLGIDAEAIEFEWNNIFPGRTSLQIRQEIQYGL